MDEEDGRLGPTARQFGRFDVLTDAWMTSLCQRHGIFRECSPTDFADYSNQDVPQIPHPLCAAHGGHERKTTADSSLTTPELKKALGAPFTQNDSTMGKFRPETIQIQMKRGK